MKIKSGFFTHSCRLIVQDTIPPTGDPVQVQAQMGGSCEPGEFVANIADATEVAVSFVEEPDYTISGVQPVRILLEDMGHNQTIIESQLFITQVVEQVTVEVGQEAPGLESFVVAGQEAAFVTDLGEIDFSVLGEYPVEVQPPWYTSPGCRWWTLFRPRRRFRMWKGMFWPPEAWKSSSSGWRMPRR